MITRSSNELGPWHSVAWQARLRILYTLCAKKLDDNIPRLFLACVLCVLYVGIYFPYSGGGPCKRYAVTLTLCHSHTVTDGG